MRTEVSEILVKDDGVIACHVILSDGRSYSAYLSAGRYGFEGYLEHDGQRFLRLRDADAGLKILDERELVRRGKGRVRRIYRKRAPKVARLAGTVPVTPITMADRAKVRQQLRRAIPESVPRQFLGSREEYGSVDSWTVDYSIERHNGKWIIHSEDPGGERDAGAFANVAELVEDAWDRGYDPENLMSDLRRSQHPHLITLAHEVEEVAIAKGWLDAAPVEQTRTEMFDPEEMAKRVEKLKAEGRMPTFERVREAMGLVLDELRKETRRPNRSQEAPSQNVS